MDGHGATAALAGPPLALLREERLHPQLPDQPEVIHRRFLQRVLRPVAGLELLDGLAREFGALVAVPVALSRPPRALDDLAQLSA